MNRCCALSLILLGTMVCFPGSAYVDVPREPPAHSDDDLLRKNVVAIQATVRDMERPFLDEKAVQDSFAEAAEWKTNFAKVQHLTDAILSEKRVGHNVEEFVL